MGRGWLLAALVVAVVAVGGAAGYGLRLIADRADGASPSSTPSPPTTSAAPGSEPGPRGVLLAEDAAADPSGSHVQQLLQRHFDAINNRDFNAWRATVTRQRAAGYPEQQWRNDFGSTQDGSIVVHRIEPATTGSVALISFTSTQAAELAPDQRSTCLRWRVSYLIVLERGELRLGSGDPETRQYEPC